MSAEPFSADWEDKPHSDAEVLRAILKHESAWSMGKEMKRRALACVKRLEAAARSGGGK